MMYYSNYTDTTLDASVGSVDRQQLEQTYRMAAKMTLNEDIDQDIDEPFR